MLKKIQSYIATLLAAPVLSIGLNVAANTASAKDRVTISLVQILTEQEWAAELAAGARAAAADLGSDKVELRFLGPPGYDIQKEAQIALSEAERGTDAIILANPAAAAMAEPGRLIAKKNIPITWIVSGPSDEVPNPFFVAADPFQLGREVAERLVSALEKKTGKPAAEMTGNVVQGLCLPGVPIITQRVVGIDLVLAEKLPKATILPAFDSKITLTQSYAAWSQAINKYPNALLYVDVCEVGIKAIQQILAESKREMPLIYFDNPEMARTAVEKGEVTGIVSGNRFMEGYTAVYLTANALLREQKLPVGWVKVPPKIVTQENAKAYVAAWSNSGSGLRQYSDPEIRTMKELSLEKLPSVRDYGRVPN